MTKTEVIALLRENKNERGIANWKKLGHEGFKSFGIGLTQLRKLAKKIGRDHDLALKLWNSDVYDARVIGTLIDEPKKMTRKQAEAQVDELGYGMLAHVYCTCGATLPKAPFVRELAMDWMDSKENMRRRCGYLLLYELSKDYRDKALNDRFFTGYINRIAEVIQDEENWVKDAMHVSLMGIGKRNLKLNRAALKAAKAIGPVEVDYGDNGCEPMDIVKHLTSDWLQKKLQA
jgi:3-methyladenine DNA glycosylase AlkD